MIRKAKGYGKARLRKLAKGSLARLYPDIAAQWHHEKNGPLTPFDILAYSNTPVWWKCRVGDDHVWQVAPNCRVGKSITGCPFCCNKRLSKTNSLAAIFPELAEEWHSKKNGSLSPRKVVYSTRRKVWWQCPHKDYHVYERSVGDRTGSRKIGCPYCKGKRVHINDSLAAQAPDLAKEWHQTKNHSLRPTHVLPQSSRTAWWQCTKDQRHEWPATIANRYNSRGCPICSNKKLVPALNSLAVLDPVLSSQWHPTKNGTLKPENVFPSSNISVWWRCPVNPRHEWPAMLNSRSSGRGCPKCTLATSRNELRVFAEMKALFPSTVSRGVIDGCEVDVLIRELGIAIEYDGEYFHRLRERNDVRKLRLLKKAGFTLFRLREEPLPRLADTDVIFRVRQFDKSVVNAILDHIAVHLEGKHTNKIRRYQRKIGWVGDKIYQKAIAEIRLPREGSSVEERYPEQSMEWDYERNYPITPDQVSFGCTQEYWWRCTVDKRHSWCVSPNSRFRATGPRGCPFCAGRAVDETNSLAASRPDIAREWHRGRNLPLTPSSVVSGSNKKVWWQCPSKKSHVYEMAVCSRTRETNPRRCPFCSGRRLSAEKSLAAVYPRVAEEWHPKKNGKLTPAMVASKSSKCVWWQCRNDVRHVWREMVSCRANGYGKCPYCFKRRKSRGHKGPKG